jgi:hypothetical protein
MVVLLPTGPPGPTRFGSEDDRVSGGRRDTVGADRLGRRSGGQGG